MRVVAALGGNAIVTKGSAGTADDQRAAVRQAATGLAALVEAGHELVCTHGNGPQVGQLLIQQRASRDEVPAMPLDVLGAQTQGALGYLFAQQLSAVLTERGLDRDVVTVLTRVVVDPEDPAFATPDKPVGPHLTETELEHRADMELRGADGSGAPLMGATECEIDGVCWRKGSGGTWRRVVASPQPLDVVEAPAVRTLLADGALPVCAGGGGIPVTEGGIGVEAVVDKDRTAALLVRLVEADALLILTDVDRVALDYGTPEERWLDELPAEDARRLLAEGQFPAGSMGPKVAAAADVAERGGLAVITSLDRAADALAGRSAGTRLVRR